MSIEEDTVRQDERWMALALEEARRARDEDEVPVGAVVVLAGEVVGRGHNRTRARRDPTAHAELLAVVDASGRTGAMRLPGAVVYTTVEPCFMCAGALSHARVARVVWGVRDLKFGGCASLGRVLSDPRLNHQVEITEGVCADEARELLQTFFRSKRGDSPSSAETPDSADAEEPRVPPAPDPASRPGGEGPSGRFNVERCRSG